MVKKAKEIKDSISNGILEAGELMPDLATSHPGRGSFQELFLFHALCTQ